VTPQVSHSSARKSGKATMISFNCLTKSMKYWKNPAFEMMRSVKVETQKDDE
jgi:hypothetical protein